MYKRNILLLQEGLVPAAEVGRAINKSLSTIHRLVREEKCAGARDGKALYVDVASMARHFDSEGNAVLAKTLRDLLAKTLRDNPKPPPSLAPAREA